MAITISSSVGRNAVNALPDVAAIGGALVGVGVENGGIFSAPLGIDWLGDAIAHFQGVQGLMASPDGRIDPGGGTLRRINAILFPDEVGVRKLVDDADLATTVGPDPVWAPDQDSLVTDFVFEWTGVAGSGSIHYFQLDAPVVPRWFGVLVPDGTTAFDRVHLFFHPTPAQAGYIDGQYQGFGPWRGIFHYLSDAMATQFCAAQTGRVLVMPLFTQSSAADCGLFPQRWPEVLGCILGRLAHGVETGAPFQRVTDVVVSSFSSGITYSHQFRSRANLGGRLAGVIDFDGIISSFSALSQGLTGPSGRVVKVQQSAVTAASVPTLAAANVFPVPQQRWGGPWAGFFNPNPGTAVLEIHGWIPQTMMQIAAQRAG